MKCAEILTRDTLLIPSNAAKLKKLLEINVAICSKKYKYVDTPKGKRLLIEGIKAYTVSYIADTKRERIITKTIKLPFGVFVATGRKRYGYRSIEFIIEKLNVNEVRPLNIITDLEFKVVCYENYVEEDGDFINSEIIDIKPSESTLKLKKEKELPFSGTYKNSSNSKEFNGLELLSYFRYQNGRVLNLVLFLLIIYVCFKQNKLR